MLRSSSSRIPQACASLMHAVILIRQGAYTVLYACAGLCFMCMPVCRRRAAELGVPSLKVLEVGGGDGRLTAHLKEALGHTYEGPPVGFICTDSGRGGLHLSSPFRCA